MHQDKSKKNRLRDATLSEVYARLKNEFYKKDLNESNSSSQIKMQETKTGYHIEIHINGYVKDDFNFYITSDGLVVTTERNKEINPNQKGDENILRHSYCYASAYFKKVISLPHDITIEDFFFDYKDGVLSIDLFKFKYLN